MNIDTKDRNETDIAELNALIERATPKKLTWCEKGEKYLISATDGALDEREYTSDFDDEVMLAGNGYPLALRTQAERDQKVKAARSRIMATIYTNGMWFEPDWKNGKQEKWQFVGYDWGRKVINSAVFYRYQHSILPPLATEADLAFIRKECRDDIITVMTGGIL